jgi:hypothetical protein
MADKELTLRMDSQEYRALRLHAVRHGTTVEALLLDLARADVAGSTPVDAAGTRKQLAEEILQRAGIDPDSPEHQAIAARADAAVRRQARAGRPGPGGRRGAA